MGWTVTADVAGNYAGLVALRDGQPKDKAIIRVWAKDATADEIAHALERLAADMRAAS